MLWGWLIDNWSWANGKAIRRSGRSLRDMPLRDLVDVTFSLFAEWSCMDQTSMHQLAAVNRYFRDLETEYETGEPVLPGWASVGDAAARYGPNDGADPFAN